MTWYQYLSQEQYDQPPSPTDFERWDEFGPDSSDWPSDFDPDSTAESSNYPPKPQTIGIFAGGGFPALSREEILRDIIPAELQAARSWCVWAFEYHPANQKWKKRPYVPFRGGRAGCFPASAAKTEHWVTIERAYHAATDDIENRIEGIGRFFSGDDGFVGIDLDHCIDDAGNLFPWATAILASFAGAYVEYSPSGRGLKLWTCGKLPGRGIKVGGFGEDGKGAIEIYDRDRFFTVTARPFGKRVRTIADGSTAVLALYEQLQRRGDGMTGTAVAGTPGTNPSRSPIMSGGASVLSDELVIAKARNAYPEFGSLFDSGDLSRYGGDRSRADAALARQIAFFSGGDRHQIERIFGWSALARRSKWTNRPDYREATIAAALASLTKFYDPNYRSLRRRCAASRSAQFQ